MASPEMMLYPRRRNSSTSAVRIVESQDHPRTAHEVLTKPRIGGFH
jgi:hypothetical protein